MEFQSVISRLVLKPVIPTLLGVMGTAFCPYFLQVKARMKKKPQVETMMPPTIRPSSKVRGIKQSPATCTRSRDQN